MKYIKPFKYSLQENIDEFPTGIRNDEDVKDWLKWSQNNTTDEKENKLVMNFLDHYHHTEKIKDEEKQMVGDI